MNISSIHIKRVPIERDGSLLSRSIKTTFRFTVYCSFYGHLKKVSLEKDTEISFIAHEDDDEYL